MKRRRCAVRANEVAQFRIEDMVHQIKRAACPAEIAHDLAWFCPPPLAGIHHLQPVGPWPAAGTVPAKNGRLPWSWVCSRCGGKASDSSRVLEVLRKPCGNPGVKIERDKHVWSDAAEPTCSRCGLVCGNGRLGTARDQYCPVPSGTLNNEAWPAGEASLRREVGRLHAFRKWCEQVQVQDIAGDGEASLGPQGGGEHALGRLSLHREGSPPGEGAMPTAPAAPPFLAPARFHLCTKLGRYWFCLQCFDKPTGSLADFQKARCAGAKPAQEVPPSLKRLAVLWGPWATFGSTAAARLQQLIGCAGDVVTPAGAQAAGSVTTPAGRKRRLEGPVRPPLGSDVLPSGSGPVPALVAAGSGLERRAIKIARGPEGSLAGEPRYTGAGAAGVLAGGVPAIGRAQGGAARGAGLSPLGAAGFPA